MKETWLSRKRTLVATVVALLFTLPGLALALPAEKSPDDTPMVDGPVRSIAKVGDNVWVGGAFSRVRGRDGALIDTVSNVAVFDSATGQYKDVAPMLGDGSAEVYDMTAYGDDVLIAGRFAGPTEAQANLVVLDGTTGEVIRWYDSPVLKSVLAAPQLGTIYGGGVALSAFDFATGEKLWTRSATAVDGSLRENPVPPGYRDLELDADGQTIWAACICDAVEGHPAKALVKLNTEGAHDASWAPGWVGSRAFGMSLVDTKGALFLGAGGNDFLARFSKSDGSRVWRRDASGSVQAVEAMDDQLVIGGHFWEVSDDPTDPWTACGHRSADNSLLDPNDECQTRHGLAAYSFDGVLEPDWAPDVSGKYSLVWALQPDGARLHFGGDFTKVDETTQSYYARLSSAT